MRGVARWLAVLAVAAIVAVLGGFTVHRALAPSAIFLEAVPAAVPADGFSTVQLRLHSSSSRALRELQVSVEDPRPVQRAGNRTGTVQTAYNTRPV